MQTATALLITLNATMWVLQGFTSAGLKRTEIFSQGKGRMQGWKYKGGNAREASLQGAHAQAFCIGSTPATDAMFTMMPCSWQTQGSLIGTASAAPRAHQCVTEERSLTP